MSTLSMSLNPTLLTKNAEGLKKVNLLLKELEERGFLRNGQIVYEEEDGSIVGDILDKYMS